MDIHRCRFVPYNPQAINALAFSHPPSADLAGRGVPTLRLAVGRANGDIEIWNPLRGAWFQETVLRGGKDRSIEGLAWTSDPSEDGPDGTKLPGRLRLFSIGYSTTVTEWDLEQGRPLRHSSGNYGEIWCIAAQPRWQRAVNRGKDGKVQTSPAEGEFTGQHLAAGCADGSIVILSTADNDLKYLRLMRPSTKRARVLSVTFQDRNTIVAGYADSSIRLFDIRSGQLLRTISLGRGPAGGNKELLVWSVKCLPDGTIVSADSAGEIRFWDAKNYSLIQRIQGHLADALDVAVSANGDTVISGGADQRTVVYRKKEGEKGDKRARWAEVMHRRYHTHDVKTFAVYETKDISIAVSGGPDAAPVVLPLREFGKEHHRKLSSLPQVPQLASSTQSRLVMSFWDREVSIWRISRGPTALPAEGSDGQKHRLVGKVLIQGEENITSAMLSSDGKLLAVSTISSVKLFSVRRRKGDDRGTLRIQKLDVPADLSDDGARLATISKDSRWLCVVRPNSDIYLARIESASTANERPQVIPTILKLNRLARHTRHEKTSHGSLGDYDRSIRCVVFSDDSKMLASGDLSGCVDTWTLKSGGDSESATALKTNGVADSDEDSDDDEDDEAVQAIDGESWHLACPESPIPRLKSGVIILSFRPVHDVPKPKNSSSSSSPSPYSSTIQNHRLMVLTSEHQLTEFDATDGKLTDWSRRNPKAYLPAEFRGVKDRAMGCVWDLFEGRERLWLYGTSWLWMFDLAQDFPSSEATVPAGNTIEEGKLSSSSSHKRKRGAIDDDDTEEHYTNASDGMVRRKPNTGAGDRIPRAQADVSLGGKMRKVIGKDYETGDEWISLEKKNGRRDGGGGLNGEEGEVDEAYEYDDLFTTANEQNIARLRRSDGDDDVGEEEEEDESKSRTLTKPTGNGKMNGDHEATLPRAARQWWHTYKYREILGIVPLSVLPRSEKRSEDVDVDIDVEGGEGDGDGERNSTSFEVAIVERPMWDVDLPRRYVRDYE